MENKPTKVLMSITLKKGTDYNQIKKEVHQIASKHFGISVDNLHFKLPCCNTKEDFSINNIPLEDYVCQCGKTKLFEYKWID